MLFSVIIPTYNRADLLDKCLQSLCDQTFKDFEVLVCDDGSTDNSEQVTQKYAEQLNVQYLWAENWGGPARPRNRGISASKGEWICFLDSDDWWTPNKLEACLPYLENYDMVYHNMRIVSCNSRYNNRLMRGRELDVNVPVSAVSDILINSNPIANSSVVILKSILDHVGGITTQRELIAVEDVDCWIRVILDGARLKFVDSELGFYWVGQNISQTIKHIEQERSLYNKYLYLFDEQTRKNTMLKTLNFKTARLYHTNSQFKNAMKYYVKSMSCSIGIKRVVFSVIGYSFAMLHVKI